MSHAEVFFNIKLNPFSFLAMVAFTGNAVHRKPSEPTYEVNISLTRFCSDLLVHCQYLNYLHTIFALLRGRRD